MEKTKNGLAVTLLIIFIFILVIGGGAYVCTNKKKDTVISNVSTSTMIQATTTEVAIGFVESVYVKNGKNYIDIDYIILRHEDGDMPWGTIVNENTKIRTFELSQNSSIKLKNKMVNGTMTTGEYSISFNEFKQIFNNKDDFRVTNPWDIKVKDGVIVEITENFRS